VCCACYFLSFLAGAPKKRGRPQGKKNKPKHYVPQEELATNRSKRSKTNSVDYVALHGGRGQEDADEDGERNRRGREGDDGEYEPEAEEDDQEEGLEQRGSLLAACEEAMGRKEMVEIKRLYDQILKAGLEHTPRYKRITQAMHQILATHNSAGSYT
jgi:hypothetical protein